MKKFLFPLLALVLCACIAVPVAFAAGGPRPGTPPPSGEPKVDVDVHVDVDVDVFVRCDHHPGCPHWCIWEWIHEHDDLWSEDEKEAFKTSKQWARRGAKLLREVLNANTDWTFTYKIHAKTANGWVELWLKNKTTGQKVYRVMNAYSHYGAGESRNKHRVFTFTTGHLTDVKLADYPEDMVVTDLELEMEEAIFEFAAYLQDIEDYDTDG